MKKFILATGNKNKVKEIKAYLKDFDIEIIPAPEGFDPIEDGKTFTENAYIKAKEAARLTNLPAIADDSGLEIDALNGAPGINSARYAKTNETRIQRVLSELNDFKPEEKTAHFTCAMVVVDKDGNKLHECIGQCKGLIIDNLKGNQGFGYDPIFFIPELNKTMAELTMDEKNQISHRSRALQCLKEWMLH